MPRQAVSRLITLVVLAALTITAAANPLLAAGPRLRPGLPLTAEPRINMAIRIVDVLLAFGPAVGRMTGEFQRWRPPVVVSEPGTWMGSLVGVLLWVWLVPEPQPADPPAPLPSFHDLYQPIDAPVLPPELQPGPDGW
ncbi:MAG: hypothetical protein GX442_08705 [Candidatus Riflebacteria bacterium]|nr:hypothetical protein [Candidatus Riflebacteria bacterium]